MKSYKPILIALACVLAVSVVGNFYLYTSLSSANAQIAEYGTLESDVDDLKSRVASLESDVVELKKSKLIEFLGYSHYLNEISVSGARR